MFFWPGKDNGKYQEGHLIDWRDEYSEEHDDAIANPVIAYFFLSDDAQDEISENDRKEMKCRPCGYTFMEINCIWQVLPIFN